MTRLPDLPNRACLSFLCVRDRRFRLDAVAHRDVRRGNQCLHQGRPMQPDAVVRTECPSRLDEDAVRPGRSAEDADGRDQAGHFAAAAECCVLSAAAEPAADAVLLDALLRRPAAAHLRDPVGPEPVQRPAFLPVRLLRVQVQAVLLRVAWVSAQLREYLRPRLSEAVRQPAAPRLLRLEPELACRLRDDDGVRQRQRRQQVLEQEVALRQLALRRDVCALAQQPAS
jgi:hypothetical protein